MNVKEAKEHVYFDASIKGDRCWYVKLKGYTDARAYFTEQAEAIMFIVSAACDVEGVD